MGCFNFAFKEAERVAEQRAARIEARAAAAAAAEEAAAAAASGVGRPGSGGGEGGLDIVKSPSFSCHSYELFVGANGQDDNNKEKMSIRSEGLDSVSEQRRVPNLNKMRKVSAVSVLIFIETH